MEEVTLLVQGKITQETYNFFTERYPQYPIVVSTWSDHRLDLSYFPKNLTLVLQRLPGISGDQNQNYQFVSTNNGLTHVTTPYVIKFRGDEYYSNIENIMSQIKTNPNKIWCSPVFFRHWSMYQYHISDHIIAGKTENLKFMFQAAKYAFDNKLVFHTKDNIKYPYWEPEIHLTRSFLMAKYPNNFHELDGRQLMVDNFDILNLAELTPYKVMCNLFKTYWFGDFTPEKNYSISKIEQLLNDKPPYEK
jgi:hypothetical protein